MKYRSWSPQVSNVFVRNFMNFANDVNFSRGFINEHKVSTNTRKREREKEEKRK